MMIFLVIILAVVALCAAAYALHFSRLYRKEKAMRTVTSETSPSTIRAINDLEMVRRPDEVFFIRMVKDLKSPLTLLSGPVEQLDSSTSLSSEDRKMLQVMKGAVGRMERIVDQLSDFSQPDFRGLRLCLSRDYPVCGKIRQDMGYFRSNADLLGIKIEDGGIDGDLRIPLDLEKFDGIFQNLLYSTLKFVFREGEVSVRTGILSGEEVSRHSRTDSSTMAGRYFMLNIFHSGETLDEDALEAIFGREYLYLDSREFAGVGLYYARELTRTHKGYIWASNSDDGLGVNFTLALPVDGDFYAEEDYGDAREEKESPSVSSPSSQTALGETSGPESGEEPSGLSPDLPTILLVIEDHDMLSYLSILLGKEYNVVEESDNAGAMESISERMPDVVISDVRNPSGGAIDLCRAIRRNDLTCRIPFILLTDEKKDEGNIDALQSGVDAMLEKPFKPAMLSALITSLLRRRDLAKGHLIDPDGMVSQGNDTAIVSEEDRLLFDALCSVIREQASNPDLTVPLLCEMLHISRTKLYNKVNGIVGMSPKRFIHEYRLKIAAQMLSEGNMTVGEVADATGFNSLSYFSKAFRKRYGKMPSSMKK
ncbi:MAG: helix-turn-helix domain-containing protein [Bacteroidales bacterium]|nr:helix-turn-helix domain-containing protein [Bacteroidales bacterium]